MTMHLVFRHGFGFDTNFWHHLLPCFDAALEYSFYENFENLQNIKSNNLIGIGHSLGFFMLLKLYKQGIPFKKIVGLQGFSSFLSKDTVLKAKREKELALMKNTFHKNPLQTMKSFYDRCGIDHFYQQKLLKNINSQAILNDFAQLDSSIDVPKNIPILIIGAKDDIVVPKELIEDNFKDNTNVCLKFLNKGQHQLGYIEEKLISNQIKGFING